MEQRTGITTTSPDPSGQSKDRGFTGLFHRNGDRGESFAVKDEDIPEVTKENLDTITGWGKKALNSKTTAARYAALDTLMCIALGNKTSKLTDNELAEMRIQVVELAKSKDTNASRIASSIATTLDKLDWINPSLGEQSR